MGGTSGSSEETFDASILITIAGAIDGPVGDLEIVEVEVVEALDSVDMGEIHLDYGDRDDFDDYNQLQLLLESDAEADAGSRGDGPASEAE